MMIMITSLTNTKPIVRLMSDKLQTRFCKLRQIETLFRGTVRKMMMSLLCRVQHLTRSSKSNHCQLKMRVKQNLQIISPFQPRFVTLTLHINLQLLQCLKPSVLQNLNRPSKHQLYYHQSFNLFQFLIKIGQIDKTI